MRILFVDHDAGFSGSSISLSFIVRRFLSQGNHLQILSSKSQPDIKKIYGVRGVSANWFKKNFLILHLHFSNVIPFSVVGFKLILGDLFRFLFGVILGLFVITRFKPNVVYVNEYVSISVAVSAKLLGVPVVIHVRSLTCQGRYSPRRIFIHFLLRYFSDCLVCITQIEKDQFRGRIVQATVIREFAEAKTGIAEDQSTHQIIQNINNSRQLTIINLCGISIIKGTDVFLRAVEMCLLKGLSTKIQFIMAGGIFDKSSEFVRVSQQTIQKCQSLLSYVGEVPAVWRLIESCDILVSSNTATHFSRPIIEAWQAGKAIIASDTAHNRLDVVNGFNGVIYSACDAQNLYDKIQILVNNPDIRKTISENGRITANKKFSSDSNLNSIVEICENLAHSNKP